APAKQSPGPCQPAGQRPLRQAELTGHVLARPAFQVAEHQRHAVAVGAPVEVRAAPRAQVLGIACLGGWAGGPGGLALHLPADGRSTASRRRSSKRVPWLTSFSLPLRRRLPSLLYCLGRGERVPLFSRPRPSAGRRLRWWHGTCPLLPS